MPCYRNTIEVTASVDAEEALEESCQILQLEEVLDVIKKHHEPEDIKEYLGLGDKSLDDFNMQEIWRYIYESPDRFENFIIHLVKRNVHDEVIKQLLFAEFEQISKPRIIADAATPSAERLNTPQVGDPV